MDQQTLIQIELMRRAAWDMFASAALGMSMHPGTTRDAARPLTVSQCADIADQMLRERDNRFQFSKAAPVD